MTGLQKHLRDLEEETLYLGGGSGYTMTVVQENLRDLEEGALYGVGWGYTMNVVQKHLRDLEQKTRIKCFVSSGEIGF